MKIQSDRAPRPHVWYSSVYGAPRVLAMDWCVKCGYVRPLGRAQLGEGTGCG